MLDITPIEIEITLEDIKGKPVIVLTYYKIFTDTKVFMYKTWHYPEEDEIIISNIFGRFSTK